MPQPAAASQSKPSFQTHLDCNCKWLPLIVSLLQALVSISLLLAVFVSKMGKRKGNYFQKKRKPPQLRKIDSADQISTDISADHEEHSDKSESDSHMHVSSESECKQTLCASASKLKQEMKKEEDSDSECETHNDLSGLRFVDTELFIDFIKTMLCVQCKRPYGTNSRFFTDEKRTDLVSDFNFNCGWCKHSVSFCTSKKVNKVYEVNRRFPLSMFAIGRDKAKGKRFLGNMNIPNSLNNKSWANHRNQIQKATMLVASASQAMAAVEAEEAYEGTDIIVSGDGTYQKRGFSSKNGVVTVLSVNGKKSKVLDCEVLSNHCDACKKSEKKMKEKPSDLERWKNTHKDTGRCDKNHEGTAPAMEPVGAVRIFQRSKAKHNLRYVEFLGDGDSKTYTNLKTENIYKGVEIGKLECCGHVQKRMGRQLTNKLNEMKGNTFVHNGKKVKGIGGQGKLTKKAILKIQGHFGAAIRNNKGDLQNMKKDIWAIFYHRQKNHDQCGKWCPSKSGKGDPDRNAFPDFVCEAIKPVFETLTQDSLLEKCLHGGTQNTNECFHNLIWERCPKTTFAGRKRLSVAVADATIVYNDGERGRISVFEKLGFDAGVWAKKCFEELDRTRIVAGQIEASEAMKFSRRKKSEKEAGANHGGGGDGSEYQSGAHE